MVVVGAATKKGMSWWWADTAWLKVPILLAADGRRGRRVWGGRRPVGGAKVRLVQGLRSSGNPVQVSPAPGLAPILLADPPAAHPPVSPLAAMRSAPTTTASTLPSAINAAAAESQIRVAGRPSCTNS